MTLIKVGDRYINLDQVAGVLDDGDGLIITLAGLAEPEERVLLIDTPRQVAALRAWLDGRASDVLRLYEVEKRDGPR